MSEDIAKQIVARVKNLPALPAVVTQVLRITRDPDATADHVARVVAGDQSLTARVLRMANSPMFGMSGRIATVTDAVRVLGFDALRSLVLAGSVSTGLKREVAGYSLESGELWRHSMACGAACLLIGKRVKMPQAEEAFVAGILHDVGKVVLGVYVGKRFDQLFEQVAAEGIAFTDAERSHLGLDHADVGGIVSEAWGLPAELCEAIRFHHRPSEASEGCLLARVVHVGDFITLTLGIGMGGDGLAYPLDEAAIEAIGLVPDDLQEIMADVPAAMEEAAPPQEDA